MQQNNALLAGIKTLTPLLAGPAGTAAVDKSEDNDKHPADRHAAGGNGTPKEAETPGELVHGNGQTHRR